jgi:hypothetical protein
MLLDSRSSPFVLLVLGAVSVSLLWHRFATFSENQEVESPLSSSTSARTGDSTKDGFLNSLAKIVHYTAKDARDDPLSSSQKLLAANSSSITSDLKYLQTHPSSGSLLQNQAMHRAARRKRQDGSTASWSLLQQGKTGVSAQQISVVGEKYVLIIDKVILT